jgi:hypothetical protein
MRGDGVHTLAKTLGYAHLVTGATAGASGG